MITGEWRPHNYWRETVRSHYRCHTTSRTGALNHCNMSLPIRHYNTHPPYLCLVQQSNPNTRTYETDTILRYREKVTKRRKDSAPDTTDNNIYNTGTNPIPSSYSHLTIKHEYHVLQRSFLLCSVLPLAGKSTKYKII